MEFTFALEFKISSQLRILYPMFSLNIGQLVVRWFWEADVIGLSPAIYIQTVIRLSFLIEQIILKLKGWWQHAKKKNTIIWQ